MSKRLAAFERRRNAKRIPLAKIPATLRVSFWCERWHSSLSRWSCALRWRAASESPQHISASNPNPSEQYHRCKRCEIGRANAALVPAGLLAKGKR